MDSKLPLRSTCTEQIYMDMFTPTYCQCFVLQSQALPASSTIGPYFHASVPLASIPNTALIFHFCLAVCCQVMLCVMHSCSWLLRFAEHWKLENLVKFCQLFCRTVRIILPLYIRLISVIIWLAGFRPVSFTCQYLMLRIFRTFCKPCNRNICWTFCKLGSLIKSNFDR